jgi:hypothetical protein
MPIRWQEAKAQADSFTHDVAAGIEAGQWREAPFAIDREKLATPEQLMLQLDDEDAALVAMRVPVTFLVCLAKLREEERLIASEPDRFARNTTPACELCTPSG